MVGTHHDLAPAASLLEHELEHQRGHVGVADEMRIALAENARLGVEQVPEVAEMDAVVELAENLHGVVLRVRA